MREFTLGACLIVKDEADNIKRCINTIAPQVDVIYLTDTGSTDDTIKIAIKAAKNLNTRIEVSHFEWTDDYAQARNFNFAQAETDWIVWLDADDTLEDGIGKKLKDNFLKKIVQNYSIRGITGVAFKYRYWVDENGVDKMTHGKLRLVRNGMYTWGGAVGIDGEPADGVPVQAIHENLMAIEGKEKLEAYNSEVVWRHHTDEEHFKKSAERNLRILRAVYEQEGEKHDPRTLFLLARELFNSRMLDESLEMFDQYLEGPGLPYERVFACSIFCQVYAEKGEYEKQRQYAFLALQSSPEDPTASLLIASYYMLKGNYTEAQTWISRATKSPYKADDMGFQSPQDIAYRAATMLAMALERQKDYESAKQVLLDYYPVASPEVQEMIIEEKARLEARQSGKRFLDAFTVIANTNLGFDNLEAIQPLLKTVPPVLQVSDPVINLKHAVGLGETYKPGNITIVTGSKFIEWDDNSLESGIGGSETAVIEMSRRWKDMGYTVDIYGPVDETRAFYDGAIKYHSFEDIPWENEFDIFISWRSIKTYELWPVRAAVKCVWLHDVPDPADFPSTLVSEVDKIIVLSEYHRSLLPDVPDEKIYISRNGIDLPTIAKVEQEHMQRNQHRAIYSSSPDRGLEFLLDIWPDVLKEVPDAELELYYGWDTFDKIRFDEAGIEWKAKIQQKIASLGLKDTVRLNKEDLYQKMISSSVWAYPTDFPEISCITAMEMQALGCIPVTTGFAALAETQFAGTKVERDGYKDALVEMFKRSEQFDREAMAKESQRIFSWDDVAKEWATDLFHGTQIEEEMPLVSILCMTIRPGIFRILKETVEAQTYPNIELIVIDGRYEERYEEVAEYMKDFKYPFLHLPDPQRDEVKYPYGLYHANNAAVHAANGELLVFLQDFIIMPDDGVERFVDLYRRQPDCLYTGVDTRNAVNGKSNKKAKIDVFGEEEYEIGEVQFTSPRIRLGGATRQSHNPMEWELNYAAAPAKLIKHMGGWDVDWDKAFGYDNTVMALRVIYQGGVIIVDEKNKAIALSHWDIFPDDKEGVPHRNKATNDRRFENYVEYLNKDPRASVIFDFKKPKYTKEFNTLINDFKHAEQ